MQQLPGQLPLHDARSPDDLNMPLWRIHRLGIRRRGTSRRLHASYIEEAAIIQPPQPQRWVRRGLGIQLQSRLHGLKIQGRWP